MHYFGHVLLASFTVLRNSAATRPNTYNTILSDKCCQITEASGTLLIQGTPTTERITGVLCKQHAGFSSQCKTPKAYELQGPGAHFLLEVRGMSTLSMSQCGQVGYCRDGDTLAAVREMAISQHEERKAQEERMMQEKEAEEEERMRKETERIENSKCSRDSNSKLLCQFETTAGALWKGNWIPASEIVSLECTGYSGCPGMKQLKRCLADADSACVDKFGSGLEDKEFCFVQGGRKDTFDPSYRGWYHVLLEGDKGCLKELIHEPTG